MKITESIVGSIVGNHKDIVLRYKIVIYYDINMTSKLAYSVKFGIGYMNFTLLGNACFQFWHGYIVFKLFNE